MTDDLELRGDPKLMRRGIFRGVDLAALADRLWALQAMDGTGRRPGIQWRAFSRGAHAWGTAWILQRQITMRITVGASIEQAAESVLHELVHCALPRGVHHGELFCRRLILCAREAWGLDLDVRALLTLRPDRLHSRRAYAIDAAIVEAMKVARVGETLRAGADFAAPPPETPAQTAARHATAAADRIAAREVHARDMLARWERKERAAKRYAAKWRRRVRYYDRRQQAAKERGSST